MPDDRNQVQVILGEKVDSGTKSIPDIFESVDEASKEYGRLLHYSNFQTLSDILKNQTLRFRPLNHLELNDQFEAKRIGLEKFAGYYFVSCFTHCQYEMVSFWKDYGGDNREKKLLFKFRNFANFIDECFHKDYCLVEGGKIYFMSEKYREEARRLTLMNLVNLKHTSEYDINTRVRQFRIVNINYRPIKDSVFTENHEKHIDVKIGETDFPSLYYSPNEVMARYKTEHWSCEQETRIVCAAEFETLCEFDYMDIRLKPEIFRDLVIITNPWATDNLYNDVIHIVNSSSLPDDIKESIAVEKSELLDQVRE